MSFGAMLDVCHELADFYGATLANMKFIKPLDEKMLKKLVENNNIFITVEDNVVAGGVGSAVNEFVDKECLSVKVKNIGLPDKFLPHGSREEILELVGLSYNGIKKGVDDFLEKCQTENSKDNF